MLADFELNEINRLNFVIDQERARMASLLQMLRAVGVHVWFDGSAITVINEALEAPYPIALGLGYMGLGAGGT